MLKTAVFFLLLVNAVLFALIGGYLEPLVPSGREPQRLQQQIGLDKIRLLGTAAIAAPVTSAPLSLPPAAAGAPAESPVASVACIELGDFSQNESARLEAQLAALSLTDRLTRRPVGDGKSYMVYIPSQGDKESAERKSRELRRLQVEDFYVLQESGELRYGISLGVFKSKAAAEQHLVELNLQGVRSARIGARGAGLNKVAFQLRGLDDATVARVIKLAKVEQRDCAPL